MKNVVFYRSDAGNEVVLDEIKKLTRKDKAKVGEDLLIVQMAYPVGPPLCRPLRNGLWEVRSSLPSGREFRLIYIYDSETENILVVNAFIKKTRRTPASEVELSEERWKKLKRRQ